MTNLWNYFSKFLDELMMTTNDADSIGGAFLKHVSGAIMTQPLLCRTKL